MNSVGSLLAQVVSIICFYYRGGSIWPQWMCFEVS